MRMIEDGQYIEVYFGLFFVMTLGLVCLLIAAAWFWLALYKCEKKYKNIWTYEAGEYKGMKWLNIHGSNLRDDYYSYKGNYGNNYHIIDSMKVTYASENKDPDNFPIIKKSFKCKEDLFNYIDREIFDEAVKEEVDKRLKEHRCSEARG